MSHIIKPKRKIYISINCEGFGHSSRGLAIARQIAQYIGADSVLFGSYGYVYDRVVGAGFKSEILQPEIKFVGKNGAFDKPLTALNNLGLPFVVAQQTQLEKRIMEENDICCVVSDCRSAAVLAAYELGLPCIYSTNQTDIDIFFQPNGKNWGDDFLTNMLEPGFDKFFSSLFRKVDEIIIGDFPDGNAVCQPILSQRPEIKGLQKLVGPLTSWKAADVVPQPKPGNGPYVVGTLGGHKFRLPLFNALVETARMLPNVHFDIIGSFPCDNPPPNLRLISFVNNPESYYLAADAIVTQAGHSTTMEMLALGRPSIIVPDYGQDEQESNAQRMAELGCATVLTYDQLSAEKITAGIKHMLETPSYAECAQKFGRKAAELNGAETVARLVLDYANGKIRKRRRG